MVEGEPSHASRPDQGRNAVLDARPILDAFDEYDAAVREREDDLVEQAYSTVTMVEDGTKENMLPETATITIDRRFLPDEEIDAEIESDYEVDTSWERIRTYESTAIPADSDLVNTFRRHSAPVKDIPMKPRGIKASTDVQNFVNDANMTVITWGAGHASQAHTTNTSISRRVRHNE